GYVSARMSVTGTPLVVTRPAVHCLQLVLERGRAAVVAVGAVPGEPVPESSRCERLLRAAAEEQVAQVAVVSTDDDGVAGHLGAVRPVVGGRAVQHLFTAHGSCDQVWHDRTALADALNLPQCSEQRVGQQ